MKKIQIDIRTTITRAKFHNCTDFIASHPEEDLTMKVTGRNEHCCVRYSEIGNALLYPYLTKIGS